MFKNKSLNRGSHHSYLRDYPCHGPYKQCSSCVMEYARKTRMLLLKRLPSIECIVAHLSTTHFQSKWELQDGKQRKKNNLNKQGPAFPLSSCSSTGCLLRKGTHQCLLLPNTPTPPSSRLTDW